MQLQLLTLCLSTVAKRVPITVQCSECTVEHQEVQQQGLASTVKKTMKGHT